jgi:hypothetical protein
MTVHWNARKGFARATNQTHSADGPAESEAGERSMPELLWALRKVPETRSSAISRARRLLADPDYPPGHVMKKVAALLAHRLGNSFPEGTGGVYSVPQDTVQ